MTDGEPSYIDYETFLDPEFSPASFANSLVISTNDANDSPLDLSTPLSRVLFDLQEIDTHIHTLTTKSALPLLTHTREQTESGQHVVKEVEEQVASLTLGYQRLEKEVLRKWEAAEEARLAAENSWAAVRLARAVGRCLSLGRQLEGQLTELSGRGSARQEHKILSDAAYTIISSRRLLSATGEGEEGYGLDRVKVIRTLKSELVIPAENTIKARTQQIINRFSMSTLLAEENGTSGSSSGYKQALDAKARVISAITTLYILSPAPRAKTPASDYRPELLLSTLQGYMHTSLTTSLSALTKSLTMLPTLERTLIEISARCQDIVALETILGTLRPPQHPLLEPQPAPKEQPPTTVPPTEKQLQPPSDQAQSSATATTSSTTDNLLQPLLQSLDTSSLPSYFWRSLASSLRSRVHDIVSRGGVSARTLKSNADRLRAELRECVLRGSQLPAASVLGRDKGLSGKRDGSEQPVVVGNWEREAAVMVGAVVNTLGK
ncbi:Golgi transport complex component Cog5, putative [Paecilomyces variotii No. 5]|uniref:Conserved oligomeric Golgi complex subunit 5 n=1 Tax=Byssochlamys spectabilis (strain No. 5 / NBRC 109023) TaxID=1356009 RepID=V5FAA4_BYSSN|nr:Golgi transport complex component Cog5, putative [Paecilomyces variotii No. 5]